MEKDFLKDLNPQQQKPVEQTDGPMIILAGAGSGKTRVLTYKVLYLIKKGVSPLNILMVTFTNKAANEMKERVKKYISQLSNLNISGINSQLPNIATFHSLCAKILRVEGQHIGLPREFTIFDSQDQIDAIKEAFKKLNLSIKDYKPNSVLATISQAKNELIDEKEYLNFAKGHFQEVVAKVYIVYQDILKENYSLDFDDLILKTISLFDKNPQILEKYQERFRYILIDEYQDTNKSQYILTKMLGEEYKNICVVGDFSQSIYSWRGADYRNLTKFKEDFNDVKSFSLSQNYRSTQKILDAASSVISKNDSHPVLKLWTENEEGEEVTIYEARNEHDEADYIINQIPNFINSDPNFRFKDIAILYRTNAQSRVIEEVFLHQGLPYILIGGTRFYERKEIKDIVAYLRVLANPKDTVSFKRIEKLGKGRLQKFLELSGSLSPEEIEQKKTIDLLDEVVKKTEYLSFYDEKDEEDRQRLENIKEIRSVAIEFPNIIEFLENIALVEQDYASRSGFQGTMPDKASNEKPNAITLMTLHAAKGLEFPIVFMVGMEEGLFPHSRSLMEKLELEEERRLCYVGMTRAKHRLFLTHSRKRLFFGQRTSNMVSRFIFELPEEVLSQNSHLLNKTEDTPETNFF
ncbi:ATP-dependent DNA helicase PcrA [Candidatus Microgenomates bacterium]|nr:MAG: ATP-dependent DNA helicase PcrA [Candidatus Microgenomates bacterium]